MGQRADWGKKFIGKCTLLLTVLTTMGICNVTASFLKWHGQAIGGFNGFRV